MPPAMGAAPRAFANGGPVSAQDELGGTQIAKRYAQGGPSQNMMAQGQMAAGPAQDPSAIEAAQNPMVQKIASALREEIGDDIPVGVLDQTIDLVKMALAHPQQYDEIRKAAIKDKMIPDDVFPKKFDHKFLGLALVVLQGLKHQMHAPQEQQQFATGGLAKAAETLQKKGRNGDTILAHINPQEAAMLRAQGGAGTINPHTGLVEYSWLSKAIKGIGHALTKVRDVVEAAAPISWIAPNIASKGAQKIVENAGHFLSKATGIHNWNDFRDYVESNAVLMANYFLPGSSMLTGGLTSKGAQERLNSGLGQIAQLVTGGVGGLQGNMANYGKLLNAGKSALGIGQAAGTAGNAASVAASGASGAATGATGAATGATGATTAGAASNIASAATPATSAVASAANAAPASFLDTAKFVAKDLGSKALNTVVEHPLAALTAVKALTSGGGAPPPDVKQGIESLSKEQQEYFNRPNVQWDYDRIRADAGSAGMSISDFMNQNWSAISGGAYNKEQSNYASDQAKTQNAARGGRSRASSGALSKVAYLAQGSGSGRADTIDAKLSDGEYVIDAETVALLGDGSTKEGARRLDMMRQQLRRQKGKQLARGQFSQSAKMPLAYIKGAR